MSQQDGFESRCYTLAVRPNKARASARCLILLCETKQGSSFNSYVSRQITVFSFHSELVQQSNLNVEKLSLFGSFVIASVLPRNNEPVVNDASAGFLSIIFATMFSSLFFFLGLRP